jgi:hypothetical protein
VSQRTLDDNTEACRSADVAISGSGSNEKYPEFGCYEDDNADQSARLVDFTCSDSPFGRTAITVPPQCGLPLVSDPARDRQDCTDQESCTVTDNGQEFTIPNGCAPGYVNLLGETNQTGAQVICSAYCAPLDTDTSQSINAIGDATALGKDVTDTAAKAKRATCAPVGQGGKAGASGETCIYGWQFGLDSNTQLLPTNHGPQDIDHIGVCFEDAEYTYDPTGGSNATTPEPSCGVLLPGSGCTVAEDNCGSDLCIDNAGAPTCHETDVACGSGTGSAKGTEADCFAVFHGCYNSIEEGVVDTGSGSASINPHHKPMLSQAVANRGKMGLRTRESGKFRRPGGIH